MSNVYTWIYLLNHVFTWLITVHTHCNGTYMHILCISSGQGLPWSWCSSAGDCAVKAHRSLSRFLSWNSVAIQVKSVYTYFCIDCTVYITVYTRPQYVHTYIYQVYTFIILYIQCTYVYIPCTFGTFCILLSIQDSQIQTCILPAYSAY